MMACSRCEKLVNDGEAHQCYGQPSIELHELDGKPLCHACWDREFSGAVDIAEIQIDEWLRTNGQKGIWERHPYLRN